MCDTVDGGALEDARHLDVTDDYQRRYWAGRFNCSIEDLLNAAQTVGTRLDDIRAHLISR